MNQHDPKLMQEIMRKMEPQSDLQVPDFFPKDAPFSEEQLTFLNGMFTGLHVLTSALNNQQKSADADIPKTDLKIFFGTQSGTAESLSKEIKKHAVSLGFNVALDDLDGTNPVDLANYSHVLIIAATYGEGDPTDNAVNFYQALMAEDAPQLPESLHFSVLGLGDSSYAHFNKAATEIDKRLAELGATRVADMVACDVDYDDDFAAWKSAVFSTEKFQSGSDGPVEIITDTEPSPAFDKNHPFMANLITSKCLNQKGSAKTVNHIEISLAGGGGDLDYEVGDALGVWPLNDFAEVDEALELTGMSGAETVTVKSETTTLRQALFKLCDLQVVTAKTAEAWGVEFDSEKELFDYLSEGVPSLTPQSLVDGLRSLQPRLYSISSSPNKHPGEVHLTIGEVHYEINGSKRQGVASTYLGSRCSIGGSVGVYVQKSSHFHLPSDDQAPVIMIGPGTGIAPFRAFLEEREMRNAEGKNWLFFGDQHEATDYLYKDELSVWEESGLLNKLDLAWSRDGDEKVYVQHLIEKNTGEFYEWLEAGAYIYVCGDASRMAVDVDTAIHNVIAAASGCSHEDAETYVNSLRSSGRYQRDVY